MFWKVEGVEICVYCCVIVVGVFGEIGVFEN